MHRALEEANLVLRTRYERPAPDWIGPALLLAALFAAVAYVYR